MYTVYLVSPMWQYLATHSQSRHVVPSVLVSSLGDDLEVFSFTKSNRLATLLRCTQVPITILAIPNRFLNAEKGSLWRAYSQCRYAVLALLKQKICLLVLSVACDQLLIFDTIIGKAVPCCISALRASKISRLGHCRGVCSIGFIQSTLGWNHQNTKAHTMRQLAQNYTSPTAKPEFPDSLTPGACYKLFPS